MAKCKHKFVYAKIETWFAARMIIYCEKCGVDRDDLPNRRNFVKKLFGNK